MPWYPVIQPDNRVAIYSTIVDAVRAYNLTDDQAVDFLARRYDNEDPDELRRYIEECRAGTSTDDPPNWTEAVAQHLHFQGLNDTAHALIAITPPDQRPAIAYRIHLAASHMIQAIDDGANAILLALENTKAGE